MYLDALDQSHAVCQQEARIVSLVPSITELLFDLGLGDQVVGRTGFCIHPKPQIKSVPKVGGTKDVKLEAVAALSPTHVIVNVDENTKPVYEALRAFVPNVIVTHPKSPEDNLSLFRLLGGIFNQASRAESLCQQLQERIETCKRQQTTPDSKRVIYLIWRDPWMTVSSDTYVARMLASIGWVAVFPEGSNRYPELSVEQVRDLSADLCLLSSEPFPFREKHLAEVEQLAGCPAMLVDGEMISWYGSRAIAGLEYLLDLSAS